MSQNTSATRPAYRSKVGLIASSPNFPAAWQETLAKVCIADRLGFDSVWLGESWGYELFTSMAALIPVTKQIKIGAGIANIYSRTPALIASTVATLDEQSSGRVLLGLGPSGAAVVEHWHGVPFQKPLQRTREYIEIIRLILEGEKIQYHGEFFQLDRGFKLRFTPLRAHVPIYIAAMGPKMIEQTGELADGILPIYWPASRIPEMRTLLDQGSLKANRDPGSVQIAPYLNMAIFTNQTTDAERQRALFQLASMPAYYVGRMGVYYADMLTRNGFGEEVQAIQVGWQQGMKTAVAAVSPRLLDEISLSGTADEIVAKLDRWFAVGVDQPLLSMPEGSLEETETQLTALKNALDA